MKQPIYDKTVNEVGPLTYNERGDKHVYRKDFIDKYGGSRWIEVEAQKKDAASAEDLIDHLVRVYNGEEQSKCGPVPTLVMDRT